MNSPFSRPEVIEAPSPNHDARHDSVDMLVLHYTGMQSADAAIERLRDPAPPAPYPPVSSHYVVTEEGVIWMLVYEHRRAWHAGVSAWRGHTALNGRSIGIEIVNPGHEWGYRAFPRVQMEAVIWLCQGILSRHGIPARNVVGHSDIAPDRKQDPGELFDWPGLARAGIGFWPPPSPSGLTPDEAAAALREIGYPVLDPGSLPQSPPAGSAFPLPIVLAAFQRRWRPSRVDGVADQETLDRIAAVRAHIHATGPSPA